MEDVVIGATGPERIGTDVALDTVVNAGRHARRRDAAARGPARRSLRLRCSSCRRRCSRCSRSAWFRWPGAPKGDAPLWRAGRNDVAFPARCGAVRPVWPPGVRGTRSERRRRDAMGPRGTGAGAIRGLVGCSAVPRRARPEPKRAPGGVDPNKVDAIRGLVLALTPEVSGF